MSYLQDQEKKKNLLDYHGAEVHKLEFQSYLTARTFKEESPKISCSKAIHNDFFPDPGGPLNRICGQPSWDT